MKTSSIFFCIFLLAISVPVFAAANLVSNPGFEASNTDILNWNTVEFDNTATDYTIETGKAHSGKNFVMITNRLPNDARIVQNVPVKQFGKYRITGWIKTIDVGTDGVGANLSFNDRWFLSRDIKGTTADWEQIEFYLSVEDDQTTSLDLCMRLGGYGAVNSGKACFDDISMTEVADIPADANVFLIENQQNVSDTPVVENTGNTGNTGQAETKKQVAFTISKEAGQLILVVIILLCAVGVFIFFLITYKTQNSEMPVKKPDKK